MCLLTTFLLPLTWPDSSVWNSPQSRCSNPAVAAVAAVALHCLGPPTACPAPRGADWRTKLPFWCCCLCCLLRFCPHWWCNSETKQPVTFKSLSFQFPFTNWSVLMSLQSTSLWYVPWQIDVIKIFELLPPAQFRLETWDWGTMAPRPGPACELSPVSVLFSPGHGELPVSPLSPVSDWSAWHNARLWLVSNANNTGRSAQWKHNNRVRGGSKTHGYFTIPSIGSSGNN